MPTLAYPAEKMTPQCLAWLDGRDEAELPVVLHSGGPIEPHARYDILARNPRFVVTGSLAKAGDGGGRFVVQTPSGEQLDEAPCEELLPLLRRSAAGVQVAMDRPPPFRGGFIGYLGYDLAWLFEYGLPRYLPPGSALPDLWLGFYDRPIVLDRVDGTVSGSDAEIERLFSAPEPRPPAALRIMTAGGMFHREEYEAAVERIREHCLCGDLFQADLSRRISLEVGGSPVELFKALIAKSPAPFMAYLSLGDGRAVVSASPEEFLAVQGRRVRTRPIKGTRPRGTTDAEDTGLAAELLASEKDLAELTMIVDLMRNDLGRVASPGSVRVREFPVLLTLPQVHHLYATVEAELDAGRDVWDLIAASFPPGSISGAPKPKAIEVLEIVERSRRGVYTGAIGWVEPWGNAHLNVAIRTAEWKRGFLRFGVGGGITALSDAAAEFEETRDKARGLASALGFEDVL